MIGLLSTKLYHLSLIALIPLNSINTIKLSDAIIFDTWMFIIFVGINMVNQKKGIKIIFYFIFIPLFLVFMLVVISPANAIERRKDQSPREPGYVVLPYAMQMAGIGSWVGIVGAVDNISSSETDFYLATMLGDIDGYVTAITDIPIGTEHLVINLIRINFTKASIQTYDRGIDSDPDNQRLVIADKSEYNMGMISMNFWEKRLQFYASSGRYKYHLEKLLDAEGNEIADVDKGDQTGTDKDSGFIIDYTDDRKDPRKGVRVEARRKQSPRDDEYSSQFYVNEYNVTAFVPVGNLSTWAFNIFRSDAVVTDKGITDEALLRADIGIDCSLNPATEAECEETLSRQIEQTIANNKYGTASSLGGTQNMRSFPTGRFYGAHSMFYGTEFRLNVTDEFTPFDIWLAKGIRTNVQLAFFAEQGTVADLAEDLGIEWVHSYGVGARLVMASGFVFRLDAATGEEGFQTQLFLNYPWGLFN